MEKNHVPKKPLPFQRVIDSKGMFVSDESAESRKGIPCYINHLWL